MPYQPIPGSSYVLRRPSAVAVDVDLPYHEGASLHAGVDQTPPRQFARRSVTLPICQGGQAILECSVDHQRFKVLAGVFTCVALLVIGNWMLGGSGSGPNELSFAKSHGAGPTLREWSNRREGIRQYWLPAPWERYRFTVLHAVVRRDDETYQQQFDGRKSNHPRERKFVQVLAFVEETPYPTPSYAPWQTLSSHRHVIESVSCHFTTSESSMSDDTDATIPPSHSTAIIPTHVIPSNLEWAAIINCPVPPVFAELSTGTITVTLSATLFEATMPFEASISLDPIRVPKAAAGSASICISPMWGYTSASALLEWRQHHLSLGLLTVHWYARDKSVREWVNALNVEMGTKDDFFFAPPISRETYGKATGGLEDAGQYADQALYYLDCKLRSITSENPTQWVSYTDLDEHFLPKSFDPTTLSTSVPQYLASQPISVGSVCISRTNYRLPDSNHNHHYAGLHFGVFSSYFPPVNRAVDSTKCVHRLKGVETGWVHRPDVLYSGYTMKEDASEDNPIRIMHDNRMGNEGPLQMSLGPDEQLYWASLLAKRNDLKAKLGMSGNHTGLYSCSEVPCAF